MNAICISASNIADSGKASTSYRICERIKKVFSQGGIACEILDLREFGLSPCIGCGKCFDSRRCCRDQEFNTIYNRILHAGCVIFVSPHYAPIPAKLSMLLEKMEEITFLHWWKDNSYQSELYHKPAGIVSHGGGSDWALSSYKAMVNDTIANALDTIQCKVVPYSDEWNTGISLPVHDVAEGEGIFPVQTYDWEAIERKIQEYVKCMIQELSKP